MIIQHEQMKKLSAAQMQHREWVDVEIRQGHKYMAVSCCCKNEQTNKWGS